MPMTDSQRTKTQAIAENLVGSDDVRAKARHALGHDDPNCEACAAWRGRPDILHAGVANDRAALGVNVPSATAPSARPDRL